MNRLRVTLSVDDGHPLDLRTAELLARYGLRATFYLPLANREGPPVLAHAQMRALAQDFEIGSHTLSHRFLAGLDERSAWREISDGKRALEDCIGRPVGGFCYPGGRYRPLHVRQVQAAGFHFARTTQNLRMDAGRSPFEMPASAQFYPHPRAVWLRNFLSQRDWTARAPALLAVLREADWRMRLQRLLTLAQARGGLFHLWWHSLDIERIGLWDELGRFLAQLAARVPPACRLANGEIVSEAFSAGVLTPPAAPAPLPEAPAPPDTRKTRRRPHPSRPSGNNVT
jgi:peptidoglycan/xylan/chitin deacetylase (PgdA/CDA1 family)